jgi:hypothetical protein
MMKTDPSHVKAIQCTLPAHGGGSARENARRTETAPAAIATTTTKVTSGGKTGSRTSRT